MAALVAFLFAGFFAGTSFVLIWALFNSQKAFVKCDAERKRWVNKILVCEGQSQLFPDAEIMPDAELADRPERMKPMQVVSPFRKGKVDLVEKLKDEGRAEAGSKLPDEIKNKIAAAADEARNGNK